MKSTLRIVALLSTVFASSAMAYNVNKVEVFPPYLNVGCSTIGKDTVGAIGLTLNKLTTTESENSIKVSVDQSLKVCELSTDELGTKTLNWKIVNPFKGFEVQFYDVKSDSLKTRLEVIDQNSKANRFEAAIFLEDKKIALRSTLSENKNNSNNATIEISKLDLINQTDIDALDTGNDIKKTVILYNVLNTTTVINNETVSIGDQSFSGRNVTLTLTKTKNLIKVKNIEIK